MKQTPFGGTLLKNSHAKTARPLSARARLRIILKIRADSEFSFAGLPSHPEWTSIIKSLAVRYRVKIKELSYDRKQLFLTVVLSRKRNYVPFIRSLTGSLALKISGANKFLALKQSFWACRPWTCILKVLNFSELEEKSLDGYLRQIGMREKGKSTPLPLALGP